MWEGQAAGPPVTPISSENCLVHCPCWRLEEVAHGRRVDENAGSEAANSRVDLCAVPGPARRGAGSLARVPVLSNISCFSMCDMRGIPGPGSGLNRPKQSQRGRRAAAEARRDAAPRRAGREWQRGQGAWHVLTVLNSASERALVRPDSAWEPP